MVVRDTHKPDAILLSLTPFAVYYGENKGGSDGAGSLSVFSKWSSSIQQIATAYRISSWAVLSASKNRRARLISNLGERLEGNVWGQPQS